jgi:glutamate racemase
VIGVFDSGVGGLGVLNQIRRRMPAIELFYVADQERAPYGTRTLQEIADATEDVTSWLLDQGAETIVVACNTASAAALSRLRTTYPDIPFVGMEPAVKPAALTTRTGVIGVLATEATFQGELFSSVLRRHASDINVITAACPEWVELVEKGTVTGPQAKTLVADRIAPLLGDGADCLVLGCTHFPFLKSVIGEVAGPDVTILDPAPAVARQVQRVHPGSSNGGKVTLATTGDPVEFRRLASRLVGIGPTVLALSGHGNGHLVRH